MTDKKKKPSKQTYPHPIWERLDPKHLPEAIKAANQKEKQGEQFEPVDNLMTEGATDFFNPTGKNPVGVRFFKPSMGKGAFLLENTGDGVRVFVRKPNGDWYQSALATQYRALPAKIPIGNEVFRQYVETFGRRLLNKDYTGEFTNTAGKVTSRFVKETDSGQLTFDFIKETTPIETPSVHAATRVMLFIMLGYAQKNPTWDRGGFMTARDYFDAIGVERPGKRHYEMLEKYFLSVANCSVSYDNLRRGEARRRWNIKFISFYKIYGERSLDMRFEWEFTDQAVSPITMAWIEGTLTPEKAKELGGFVPFPMEYLRLPLPQHLDNIRCALLMHTWGKHTPTMHTILTKWARVKKDQLRKPDESVKKCKEWLDELKDLGIIGAYECIEASKAGKLRKGRKQPPPSQIKVKFYPPGKGIFQSLSLADQKKFLEITEWLTRKDPLTGANIHGTTTSEPKTKQQLEKAFIRHGAKKVYKEYKIHGCGTNPSPPNFWEAVFPKRKRRRTKMQK